MTESFTRTDEGQALVVVAVAMVVLMGALVLTVDWGYGFASRRAVQNGADAATLAAGRLLGSSYQLGTPRFAASKESVWCAANAAVLANAAGRPMESTDFLEVSFSSDGSDFTTDAPIQNVTDCSASRDTDDDTFVLDSTLYVRAHSMLTYQSLFGMVSRQQVDVNAWARARLIGAGSSSGPVVVPLRAAPDASSGTPGVGLSGSWTAPNVAIWPLVRHFGACDPTKCQSDFTRNPATTPITLWPNPSSGIDAREFTSVATFAHYSPHEMTVDPSGTFRHQLLTESDNTGSTNAHHGYSPTPRLAPQAKGQCLSEFSDGLWDTNGSRSASDPARCDPTNWFYYGYRGSVGLGTDWNDASWRSFLGLTGPNPRTELPTPLPPTRTSCWTPILIARPSCTSDPNARIGDWAEIANTPLTKPMAAQMVLFIQRYGREGPLSATLGKAVVVNIFLWDCAEQFDDEGGVGDRWSLVTPNGGDPTADCSTLPVDVSGQVYRVHLFSVVPFTFYERLIDTTGQLTVKAYWGDAFGNAGSCGDPANWAAAGCRLNPFMNSAFLVPD